MSIFNPPADENEKPLDPTLLRVQARLRRLILIAGLTLGLGVAAVLVAVLYRVFVATPAVVPATASAIAGATPAVVNARLTLSDLGLPPDAKLTGTEANGTRVVLTYAHSGGTTLIFLDERRLAIVGRLELPAAP